VRQIAIKILAASEFNFIEQCGQRITLSLMTWAPSFRLGLVETWATGGFTAMVLFECDILVPFP
jgi:hypothetical protein